jgi:hypothetical protein
LKRDKVTPAARNTTKRVVLPPDSAGSVGSRVTERPAAASNTKQKVSGNAVPGVWKIRFMERVRRQSTPPRIA